MQIKKEKGSRPYNSETDIDFVKKKISFNYIQHKSRRNDWEAYAIHIVPNVLFLFSFLLVFASYFILLLNYIKHYDEFYQMKMLFSFSCLTLISYFVLHKAVQGISVLLHIYSPFLRKKYPEYNACFKKLFAKWKKLDLSKQYTKNYIIKGNKIIYLSYNIVYFEYKLIGDCAKNIKRIKTVCVENEKRRMRVSSTTNFYCIFEFKKPIKKGELWVKH